MNEIGNKIRKIREEKGLSQEYMAAELDVSQSNYGRLEKDDNRLTATKLKKIVVLLGTSVAELFDEKAGNIIYTNNGHNPQSNIDKVYMEQGHIESLKEEIAFLRGLLKK